MIRSPASFVQPIARMADLSSLGAAEREVTRRPLDGHDNARIAREPGTSLRTVANQVASLFRKLGVSSRGELPPASGRSRHTLRLPRGR